MQCNLIFCRLKLPHQFHFLSVRIGPIITIITRPDICQEVLTYVNLHLNVQYSKWNHFDLIKTLTHDGMQVSLGNVTSIEQSQPCGLERRIGSWLAVRGHVITTLASDWLLEVMWSQNKYLIGHTSLRGLWWGDTVWLVWVGKQEEQTEPFRECSSPFNKRGNNTYTHIHTYTHTHRNTHTHIHTHKHTHIHTRSV